MTLSVCCASRGSPHCSREHQVYHKSILPREGFLLLSAREALREWVSPCSLHGSLQSGPRGGPTTEHFALTYLFASAHWVPAAADIVLGPGEQRAERAAPGPHLVHSPDWADRKSRSSAWGERCGDKIKLGRGACGRQGAGSGGPGSHELRLQLQDRQHFVENDEMYSGRTC